MSEPKTKYEGLATDFDNIRETQPYTVGKVIDEAEKYIVYLEGKENLLEQMITYLNTVSGDSTVDKAKMVDGFSKFLTVAE